MVIHPIESILFFALIIAYFGAVSCFVLTFLGHIHALLGILILFAIVSLLVIIHVCTWINFIMRQKVNLPFVKIKNNVNLLL